MRDRRILYAAAFLRAMAVGMIAILLGLYLAKQDLDADQIGLIVSAGLAGAAAATALVTTGAAFSRRRALIALALLGGAGGIGLLFADGVAMAALAAFLGMTNGLGSDRGPHMVMEQALLPATAPDKDRTAAFGRYAFLQDLGVGFGALFAAAPSLLVRVGTDELTALRAAVAVYALLISLPALLYLRLSPAFDGTPASAESAPMKISSQSRRRLTGLASLFVIDALGSGFFAGTLMSYFLFKRFGVEGGSIGPLVATGRVANAISYFVAVWLAGRIGLVRTMVFTHIPSSLLLVLLALAPTFPIAAAIYLVREFLVQMDVPARQSYLMAVVRPEERTFAGGITLLVRMGAYTAGPFLAGWSMRTGWLGTPLVIGASMKITYDLLLWYAFDHVKPPEEQERPGASVVENGP